VVELSPGGMGVHNSLGRFVESECKGSLFNVDSIFTDVQHLLNNLNTLIKGMPASC